MTLISNNNNLSSSFLKGLFTFVPDCAKSATYPSVVLSPMRTTTPFPYPEVQVVPKKAKLDVSRGFVG